MITRLAQDLTPMLAVALASVVVWHVRTRATARSSQRLRQLREAAEFIEAHVRAMRRFLEHPDATDGLKALLVQCSAMLEDRGAVERLVEWAATRTLDEPLDLDETRAVRGELAQLRARNPDLTDAFDTAIISAVAGASLRWPESAARFEAAFPRLAAAPQRDAAIAVTLTRLQPACLFSVRPAVAAATA